MKTRCIFTPDDFKGSGQMIIRDSYAKGGDNLSFAVSVSYKIGYVPALKERHVMPVALISMSDGMVDVFTSVDKLCDHLNKDQQGYRPMTEREIARILGAQGSRFPE